MSRLPSDRDIELDVIDVLKKDRSMVIEMYFEEVSIDKFTNREFDSLMKWVIDALEYLSDDRQFDYSRHLAGLVFMKAADFVLKDKRMSDDLNDRDYDDARKFVKKAEDLQDVLSDARGGRGGRGRGRDRDDRDERGRPSDRFGGGQERDRSSGRDYDRSARRSSRGGEEREELRSRLRDRPLPEDRAPAQPSRVSDRYSRAEERPRSTGNTVLDKNQDALAQMRAKLAGGGITQEKPAASQPVPDFPDPAVVNLAPVAAREPEAVKFVHNGPSRMGQPVRDAATLDPAKVLAKTDRPTRAQLIELGADIENPEFIATLPRKPLDPNKPNLPVLYDPTVVRMRLVVTEDGYQDVVYTEVDMNYDDAVIPDLGRPQSYENEVAQIRAQLTKVASTSRFRLNDIEADEEHQRKEHEREMKEWEEANGQLPEEEREPMPTFAPELPSRNGDTVLLNGTVYGMGKKDLTVKMWQLATENTVMAEDSDPITIQGITNEMELLYVARTDAEFEDLKLQLIDFTSSKWHDGHSYQEYHKRLMDLKGTIAPALWVGINRLFTAAVNRALQGNLGLPCWIDDFGVDGVEFLGRLKEDFGVQTVERLNKFARELMRQFHCIEFAAGEDNVAVNRGVYHRERFDTILTSFSTMELGLMAPRANGKPTRVARVTKEASPLLYKAINGMRQHEGIAEELFAIRRRILLADGVDMEIFVSWYDPSLSEYLVRLSN
ncbi:hypothetical protein CF95_gp212 [Erwinia phage PhiEaH1]|uniref:Uncharacterized protein n=1 Tax=Erwinia phage PhiEaH1 TaxID=1401669 RepID=W8D098_9CAUD|nr:hypothetical protein CF95_gp212 [Erwinia phage PhiEaH1]AGX01934.1 hypothetical protein [Erwinia phage PhiEaH1]WBF04876.1 hypothetical protein [Erwinia phage vB_Ea277G]